MRLNDTELSINVRDNSKVYRMSPRIDTGSWVQVSMGHVFFLCHKNNRPPHLCCKEGNSRDDRINHRDHVCNDHAFSFHNTHHKNVGEEEGNRLVHQIVHNNNSILATNSLYSYSCSLDRSNYRMQLTSLLFS